MVAGLLPVLSCCCSCSVLKQCHSSSSSSSSSAEAGRQTDRGCLLVSQYSAQQPAAYKPPRLSRAQQKNNLFPSDKKNYYSSMCCRYQCSPLRLPLPVFWLSIISICFYFIAWPVGCDTKLVNMDGRFRLSWNSMYMSLTNRSIAQPQFTKFCRILV